MSGPALSIDELRVEVTRLGNTLATSDGDAVGLQAQFVQRLAELEVRTPEIEHVNRELERLTTMAAALGPDPSPAEVLQIVRDLAELRGPVQRLNDLADVITAAAIQVFEESAP